MKHPVMIFIAAVIIFIAQLLLWGGIIAVQAPAAQEELASTLKLEMPQKVIPVILSYYPDLNSMSYESAIGYCEYKDVLNMNIEAEGITDEYVCEIIDEGIVSNTEELREYLSRKVVAQKVDDYFGEYKSGASQFQLGGGVLILLFGILIVLAFAILFFGTKTFPKCIFWFSSINAACSFGMMVLSVVCFLIVPGAVVGSAYSSVEPGFEKDVLSLMDYAIEQSVEGLFIEPAFLFGGLAFFFSLAAVLFYLMGMVGKNSKN